MLTRIEPIDYLVIGHLTQDVVQQGFTLGGTAAYAALTARALGARVGIITSCRDELEFPELDGITVIRRAAEFNTTFENIYTGNGRIQYLHHRAEMLDESHIPTSWLNTPIVHIGPVDNEVNPRLSKAFPDSLIGITPQGFLRGWDETGRVSFSDWMEAPLVLGQASAVVMSVEDVRNDESRIDEFLTHTRLLVVTEGASGARLYWNGDMRYFRPPVMNEVDGTGAGDIFATAFFIRMYKTRDPWESARFATQVAAHSVGRRGLQGVPTQDEIRNLLVEVVAKI
jgi:sugar/nucleoside kinase (ribokinase family)